jgi:uncharacterized membrane protein
MNLMDLNEARKEYVKRNMAEPKNWKKPFDSDIHNSIFRTIGAIFNFISSKFLITATILIIVSLILKEWFFAVILFFTVIPLYLVKFIIRWVIKNHKKIKTSKTSEGVIIVELEKDEKVNNDININQSSLTFK